MKNFYIPATTNVAAAARQARIFTRAQDMAKPGSGYKFEVSNDLSSGELYKVTNPEGITYTCDPMLTFEAKCTCPDFAKFGDVCKHLLYCNIMIEEQEAAQEAAADEAMVAAYETARANAGVPECLLPNNYPF